MKWVLKFIGITIIFFHATSAWGQYKFDLTYFTLGLVNDYYGRTIVKSGKLEPARIDQFHEVETYMMDLLDSLIREENKSRDKENRIAARRIQVKEPSCKDCDIYYNYYSKILSDALNNNYRFKSSHGWDSRDRKLYHGRIKISDFKNDAQRVSFLSGAFVRNGKKDGDIISFHLANSVEQFDLIVKALKALNCVITDITISGGTPAGQKVYCVPSEELKVILEKYDVLKRKNAKKQTAIDGQ